MTNTTMTSGQPLIVLVTYLFSIVVLLSHQQYHGFAYASRVSSSTASSSTNHNRLRTNTKFLGTSADVSSNTRVDNIKGGITREEKEDSEDDIPDVIDTRARGLEVVRDDNGSSGDDIPNVLDARRLEVVRDDSSQDTPTIVSQRTRSLTQARQTETTQQTEYVSQNCLNLIAASANPDGHLDPESYFVFNDGYSNGFYTKNNMTTFADLPEENQHVFITIACGCGPKGDADNCCQMDRAHIDVSGLFTSDGYPKDIPNELREVLWDICSTTRDAIGDNVLPPTNEGGQGLAAGNTGGTDGSGNSLGLGPVPEWISDAVNGVGDIVDNLDNAEDGTSNGSANTTDGDTSPPVSPVTENEDDGNTRSAETLSPGAIAGIAIAGGVGLLALLAGGVYASRRRKDSNNQDDEDEANRKLQSEPVGPPPNMDEMSGTMIATHDVTDDDTQGDYTFASGETVGTETHGGTGGGRHPSSSFNGNLDRLGDL